MRVLVITKVFPNAYEPESSPFNRQQFSALARISDVEILATIPWFPGARWLRRWSRAGRLVDVPARERIDGLLVEHPRALYLPKLAPSLSGALYEASLERAVAERHGRVDVVLGAWAYPDGWAAIRLARRLGVPSVVKLHGSDIDVVAAMRGPRALLRRELPRATRVVAVSRALARRALDLGVPSGRIDVVSNGVDRTLFFPRPRDSARDALGFAATDRIALYVGRLERDKGIRDLLAAFEHVAADDGRAHLALVGDGPLRRVCSEHTRRHSCRVRLAGTQPMREIPIWLAACDVLVLPSRHEGTPNVVLEALACGRRVVATDVGGIPDLLTDRRAGELVAPRDVDALAEALRRALRTDYAPETVAAVGPRRDWDDSAALLHASLLRAIGDRPQRRAA